MPSMTWADLPLLLRLELVPEGGIGAVDGEDGECLVPMLRPAWESMLRLGLKGRREQFKSLEWKISTKRDRLGVRRCSPGSAASGWSCYIRSLAIAKELYTMGKMIGEDHGARLAKATPARLTNDDWVPKRAR